MAETASSHLYIESVDGVTVVTLAHAEFVAEDVIAGLSAELNQIDDLGLAQVVVNFREVRLMSSSVLAVLLGFARRVERAGGRLKLCCIAPDLLTVFKITRFDRLFDIHAEEWSALDAFPAPARA